ncbi:hypothetical protein BJF83_13065 [Nocardiopsis sp. CNR-923]|uniref:hypothetical protein n=1 Tax=Nocardiopsis sp. CNR-923 TaxID=1904965 RepID=UPI00096975D4|nr:hypothetical protein [Nocardiopsis sp. CNR-923]OLT29030.1 hypothetical protein BJF83_13065 [Nocardiopsis sp. CNR-923]
MSAESGDGFDATIHAPQRSRIRVMLDATARDRGVSASALSEHVGVPRENGCLDRSRAARDRPQRAWSSLSREGQAAYRAHVAALPASTGA